MPIDDFTDVVQYANLSTDSGTELRSDRVYCQARKTPGPNRIQGIYHGKWTMKAIALDAKQNITKEVLEDIRAGGIEPPQGLSAQVISYECSNKPQPPEVFQRTNMHRGKRGFISGDAYCVILQKHSFIL